MIRLEGSVKEFVVVKKKDQLITNVCDFFEKILDSWMFAFEYQNGQFCQKCDFGLRLDLIDEVAVKKVAETNSVVR